MSKARIRLRELGGGRNAFTGTVRDQFRRVHAITALVVEAMPREEGDELLEFWSGDRADAMAMMDAWASCAWENGWRPKDLAGTVAGVISGYKLPGEAGPTDQARGGRR